MPTKLKNLHMTSVDLVRTGANQEADICLFKSADPTETPTEPTTEEKNIFKRFIDWLRENPTEEQEEPTEEEIEKDYTSFDSLNAARENNEKLWQYTNALTESIRSIQMDQDLDKEQKYQLMCQSMDQFDAAMDELIEALCDAAPPSGLAKSDEEDDMDDWEWDGNPEDEAEEEEEVGKSADIDEIEEVETVAKANPNHDALGRFASSPGGGESGNRLSEKVRSCIGTTTNDMPSAWEKINQSAGNTLDTDRTTKTKTGVYKIPSKTKYGPSVIASISENHSTGKCTINSVVLSKSADAEEFEEVEKFNPYHDSLGRFSSASGGGKFFATPGKSKAHDLAIQREKDRQAAAGAADGKQPATAKPAQEKPKNVSPTSTGGKLQDDGSGNLYGENDNG